MNKSLLITAATIAVAFASAATTAMAAEAVQLGEATVFVDAPASRGNPLQLPSRLQAATRVIQVGEATVFVDQPGTRSRDEVRAEARAAARSPRGDNTYLGS